MSNAFPATKLSHSLCEPILQHLSLKTNKRTTTTTTTKKGVPVPWKSVPGITLRSLLLGVISGGVCSGSKPSSRLRREMPLDQHTFCCSKLWLNHEQCRGPLKVSFSKSSKSFVRLFLASLFRVLLSL